MDTQIRSAAFAWLQQQTRIHGDLLPRKVLEFGFFFKNERISLIGPKGIWKPKIMDLPLSIITTPEGPYDDRVLDTDVIHYHYRGTDPNHPDNIGLRENMRLQKPLVYFYGVSPGKYIAVWPVYIINDDRSNLLFSAAADISTSTLNLQEGEQDYSNLNTRRSYITSTILIRLHQHSFRRIVLAAYHNQCALCRLKYDVLLDAAHIIGDGEGQGDPVINNGLALCKIHHAAFDRYIIGITPDYKIHVRKDILLETDGPMLKHGIQEMDKGNLILPRNKLNWPDRDRLQIRYNTFLHTG